jgi:hypothetical protein
MKLVRKFTTAPDPHAAYDYKRRQGSPCSPTRQTNDEIAQQKRKRVQKIFSRLKTLVVLKKRVSLPWILCLNISYRLRKSLLT